jgi:hypothetical protein
MLRQFIWLLVALLALGIIGLMIVTPTPPKGASAQPGWHLKWLFEPS